MSTPTIGRIVSYRSKTGRYSVPAIITATQATLFEDAVQAGAIPAVSSETHVHLHVLTPGLAGHRLPDTDPSIGQANPGGYYQEHDVPFSETVDSTPGQSRQEPGTWAWPERA